MSWICSTCAGAQGRAPTYPGGPDEFCCACRRALDPTERLAAAVTILLRRSAGVAAGLTTAPPSNEEPLIGVSEAAALYRVSDATIYKRHARGQMPPTVGGARPLLWRRRDLLASEAERAVSPRRGR